MGNATIPKHDLPSEIRTLKGSTLVSNSERLRSRSYSHEHELYRAELGNDAAGEWKVVRGRVPTGLVDEMKKVALRGKSRGVLRRAIRSRSRGEAKISTLRNKPTNELEDFIKRLPLERHPPTRNNPKRWSEAEIHHVGACLMQGTSQRPLWTFSKEHSQMLNESRHVWSVIIAQWASASRSKKN